MGVECRELARSLLNFCESVQKACLPEQGLIKSSATTIIKRGEYGNFNFNERTGHDYEETRHRTGRDEI
jgi:hypothetical protein